VETSSAKLVRTSEKLGSSVLPALSLLHNHGYAGLLSLLTIKTP
jgi:hypothetical protein